MLLIDPPQWPGHGRMWSHLASDDSVEELHAFAERLGIPRRGFEGDHYDVPEQWYDDVVAAGAVEVTSRELLTRITSAGLRLRKRVGERGLARARGVRFPDGAVADVDLVSSPRDPDEERTFAAVVVVRDDVGDLLVTHSVRRDQWGPPGGWREPGESVREGAVREVREETGLRIDPDDLVPVGYERFVDVRGGHLWQPGRELLQVFAVRLPHTRPGVTDEHDAGTDALAWVDAAEAERRCAEHYWWPFVAHLLAGER
ncbi:hypothetical protein GCM10027425_19610 [Alteromonas gracilis]